MKTTNDTHTFTIALTPSAAQVTAIRQQLSQQFGEDVKFYDEPYSTAFDAAWLDACTKTVFTGTLDEAQTLAEPIRIANPERHVNINWTPEGTEFKNFIANTTWEDQMNYYPEYPVYTAAGVKAKYDALKVYHHKMTQVWKNWSSEYTFEMYIRECAECTPELVNLFSAAEIAA